MIAKCEEGGNSAGQLDIKAMGQMLWADAEKIIS